MTLSFAKYSCLTLSVFAISLPLKAQFTAPTAAELAMTAIPQVPDAPAVFLFKEETTEDALHMHSFYVRLKVLTEGGKDYANVELPYYAGGAGNSIDSIAARTIQPDGSIVAFTGKPYEKLIQKGQGVSVKSKVFTLPAVQVGSILEYRYKIRYDDAYLESPQWYIQSDLYTVRAHYNWKPTSDTVVTSDDRGEIQSSIAWTPILPEGAKVIQSQMNGKTGRAGGNAGGGTEIDLMVHDVPPLPHESNMPPLNSVSYRVLFYYTSYKTAGEYWTREGKRWIKEHDKFLKPGPAVTAAVQKAVSPGDTDEVKLKKIYDAVERLENTDFTRGRSAQEDRARGVKAASSVEDILTRERGSSDELDMLFISMTRVAGMKAYLVGVADRSERIFLAGFLNLRQLDDLIAIVPINGKDEYFDAGTRYCTFKHLDWKHAASAGLRQTDDSVKLINIPAEPYTASTTKRIADLTLDEHGEATGTVSLTFTGDPALSIRHEALRGDDTSLNAELRRRLERLLPGGVDVKVTSTENLADADKPLIVKYDVRGAIGNATGKRLFIPASLFETNSKPEFTTATRDLPVDMHYPHQVQDAVRIKYPASLGVEGSPAADSARLGDLAAFSFSSKPGTNAITMFRNVTIAQTFFLAKEYLDLRTFYGKLESKQQESLILTHTTEAGKPAPGGGN